jgi:hypothetical protein
MKKILTDCDGVLLDWEGPFHEWMQKKGYTKIKDGIYNLAEAYGIEKDAKYDIVREFNESAWMCCLPVLRDADHGVATLFNHGYRFDVITSLSLDPYAKQLRWTNLNTHIGSDAFDDLICLDTGADKDDALVKYAPGHWWIEDKPENCDTGLKYGHRPILIDHPHNQWYQNPEVVRVKTWKELCEVILSE